jgi:DivIVA domain-containing protein
MGVVRWVLIVLAVGYFLMGTTLRMRTSSRRRAAASLPFPTVDDARQPPFPTLFRGYDRGEVDAFFAGITERSSKEIDGCQFRRSRHGYDVVAVDRALDGWSIHQS